MIKETNKPNSRAIIMFRSPSLSGKAREYSRGYQKIALVEVDNNKIPIGEEPKMISERSIGVIRILDCATLYYGKGIKSEGKRFLDQIRKKADKFNKKTNER